MSLSERMRQPDSATDPVGLCRTCRHAQAVTSARGSVFYLCRLSQQDPRFPKYPRLPVRRCDGYQEKTDVQP